MSNSNQSGIVVLGHPRSGTTLLRSLMDAHPNLAAPPETHLLSAASRFLSADVSAHGVDIGVLAGLSFIGYEDDKVIKNLREFIFSYLNKFAISQGKARWVEKTAFDIFHIDSIEQLCADEVYFVGIIRHPLDVAVSCKEFCDKIGVYPEVLHKFIQRYPDIIEAFVRSWIHTTEKLINLSKRRPDRCIICRYEDLCEFPDAVLNKIFDFVGEESNYKTEVLGGKVLGFADQNAFASSKVDINRKNRWSSLPPNQIHKLKEVLGNTLENCGYDAFGKTKKSSREDARRLYSIALASSKPLG